MRAYVVHPGVPFSTSDVWDGLCYGLRANGVEVVEGRLDVHLGFQASLYDAGQKQGVVAPGHINVSYFVAPYVTTEAIDYEPDVVIVVSAHNLNRTAPRQWRKAGIKTAVLMTETPYFREFEVAMGGAYDRVFTHERKGVDFLNDFHGRPAAYLPHAYHPERHTPGPAEADQASDVVFIGSLFDERRALFAGVDWSGVRFLQRGYDPATRNDTITTWQETVAYYRSSKIVLNHHRTTTNHGSGGHIGADEAVSLGPRAYEAAACGVAQLMDDARPEALDLFGDSLMPYRAGDSADLERQMRRLLAHDGLRERLATEQRAAVQGHGWDTRARQLLEAL
jgi:spore maturation protein CgeB